MTIDETIKRLQSRLTSRGVIQFGNPDADLLLGIEALKAFRVYRLANESWLSLLLSGETEDLGLNK